MVDDTQARQSAQDMKETVREEARRTGETVKGEAKAVADEAAALGREHAEQRFEQGKGELENQVDTIHSAVDGAARRLREENSPLASYADELSGQLSRLSDGIENSTLDDLAVKTRRVARENPGLFVLGSVVAGIAAGRFFKASATRSHDSGRDYRGYDDYRGHDDDRYDADYRAGREAAMARSRSDYRSPVTQGAAPYRPDVSTAAESTTGSAGRVPMDSTALGGTSSASGTSASGSSTTSTTGAAASTAGVGNRTGGE